MKEQYVKSHFLDSGAFSQWGLAVKYHKEHGGDKWDFFHTDVFYKYMDEYASFVKKYKIAIDLYANVDVIGNPELTWRNQEYLEKKHKLKPVPVVHYGTDLKWLQFYIDKKYKMIGLGGLVGNTMKAGCRVWLDECFHLICPAPKYLPTIKLHGFGVASWKIMTGYPWWSVDSATWAKAASYGGIYIPPKRGGEWKFDRPPYLVKVSIESPMMKIEGQHFTNFHGSEKKIIKEWVDFLQLPFGKYNKKFEILEQGVTTFHKHRNLANLYYFKMLNDYMPEYPQPFKTREATLL